MKKNVALATIMPICIGLGNTAIADPQSEEKSSLFTSHFNQDFTASVGIKTWFNKWDLPTVLAAENSSDQNLLLSYDSEMETTLIPVLSFRYKNFLVSGSYFPSTDYSFGQQSLDFPFFMPTDGGGLQYIDDSGNRMGISGNAAVKIPLPVSISAERSEWDINVGYYLHRSLVVTAGYKRIDRQSSMSGKLPDDFSLTFFDPAGNALGTIGVEEIEQAGMDTAFNVAGDNKTDGLTLGIASVVSLQGRLGLYGSFAYGWLETETKTTTYNSDYYLGELGLLYSPRFSQIPMLEAASVYLGYRFQFLNDDVAVGNGATDSTEGFVLGVNLIF